MEFQTQDRLQKSKKKATLPPTDPTLNKPACTLMLKESNVIRDTQQRAKHPKL